MTEEEYFRKNYPNSCYGDKPLSPHWDFFQRRYLVKIMLDKQY